MKWQGVIKIQRALYPPNSAVLIYDEERTILEQFDMTQDLLDLFEEDEARIFCEAVLDDDGILQIYERANPIDHFE